jgi:hypothetical protein
MKYLFPVLLISVFIAASCTDSQTKSLPPATGLPGDIFLIMDSSQWKGPLGKVLDSIFRVEMDGLPREEPIFKMRWIDPRKLNYVLKQRRNLIFAVTLDKRSAGAAQIRKIFTQESLDRIKTDTSLFSQSAQNVFAKGQEVLYLFGQTEQQLIKQIRKNGKRITDYFDVKERERLTQSLFKSGQLKGVPPLLRKEFQCEMKVPFGYQLVMQNDEFFWVRQINPKDDKDVFIARKKYTSRAQFSRDSLIAWRDQICRKYLFADPDRPDTHLVTETTVPFKPVMLREVSFHKKFAIEMRGLWRSNNFVMGGPFVSYTLVDEPLGVMYYLEGFTISPGRDQREIMRELETILFTFRTSDELVTASK